MKKIFFVIVVVLLLTAAFIATFYEYIFVTGEDYSGNIISRAENSCGKYIAIKTEKNAGATTPFIYRLIILENGDYLTDNSQEVFRTYSDFDYFWKNDNKVVVMVPKDTFHSKYIFLQEETFGDIDIEYIIVD